MLVFILLAPTIWVIILLIRIFIFLGNPNYKKYDKQTLALKKELQKKQTANQRKKIKTTHQKTLNLAKGYTHTSIANELIKLHKNNPKLVKAFVYHYFKTKDYRQRFRTKLKRNQLPPITTTKETYIEFYWVLYKSGILENSFADISRFLANTFGKDKNSPLYKMGNITISKYPSEKNFEKKYKNTPSPRAFFNKNPK